ncbi:hypothetical protein EON65_35650 [archaeon]|nr:MAG: hypothetical protein EON65_35650 [archaeon]
MLSEKVESLKQIPFSLFLHILHFHFSVYEAYAYYKQEVYGLYAIHQPEYVAELPLNGEMMVDLHKLKTYMQK